MFIFFIQRYPFLLSSHLNRRGRFYRSFFVRVLLSGSFIQVFFFGRGAAGDANKGISGAEQLFIARLRKDGRDVHSSCGGGERGANGDPIRG